MLWTSQTPCAKHSFGIEAAGYLPEPAGPRRKTLKQSMRFSSLHRRMKSSTSSVMSAFNALRKPLSRDSWRNIAFSNNVGGVKHCLSTQLPALGDERHFALADGLRFPIEGSLRS